MAVERHDEIERKYEAPSSLVLPNLAEVDGVAALGAQKTFDLEAVYFDTVGLDLHRHGVTLRRRTGGPDDGWHLKLPGGPDHRVELRLPLGRSARTVPTRLLDPVRSIVRNRPLAPVATVQTHRIQQTILDDAGVVIATMVADDVHGQRLIDDDEPQSWRELEVELSHGQTRELLDRLEAPLLAAGALAGSTSKVRRILGEEPEEYRPAGRKGARPRAAPSGKRMRKGPARGVLQDLLGRQRDAVLRHDAGVRAGDPQSIHQLRIAVRRLRSTLRTYQPLLTEELDDLHRELRWLTHSLAAARDAEVLRARFGQAVAGQPPELVLGPVVSRIDKAMAAARRDGVKIAREALSTPRYYRLLDSLDDLLESPPWTKVAAQRADRIIPRLLQRDAKALRRAARRARTDGEDRDQALHQVRKKAKRLRYAAEGAVPVVGARATNLAKRAKRVQTTLGEHHDSVLARSALRQWGVQAHLDGTNSFTFGRLHGLEQGRAQMAEKAFARAYSGLARRHLRRWLRP